MESEHQCTICRNIGTCTKPNEISVIIPAKGDKKVAKLVQSIVAQRMEKCEILLIRNGHISYGIEDNQLSVYKNKNLNMKEIFLTCAGKAKILNYGIKHAKYNLIAIVDADCILDSDSFSIALRHFQDSSVFGVGGKLVVLSSRMNILTKIQAIDYSKVFNISRKIFNYLDCNFIISGAFGIFRKDALLSIGGFDQDTVGEDFEIILRIHRLCKNKEVNKIIYDDKAVCFTEAPKTIKHLLHQRERWQRGFIDSVLKNKELLLKKEYGLLGRVVLPLLCLEATIGPVAIVLGSSGLLDGFIGPYVFFIVLVIQVILSVIAELSDKHHQRIIPFIIKAIILNFLSMILQVLISFSRIFGTIFFKKRRMKW